MLCGLTALFTVMSVPPVVQLLAHTLPTQNMQVRLVDRDTQENRLTYPARRIFSTGQTYYATVMMPNESLREIQVPKAVHAKALSGLSGLSEVILNTSVMADVPVSIEVSARSYIPEGGVLEQLVYPDGRDKSKKNGETHSLLMPPVAAAALLIFFVAVASYLSWQSISKGIITRRTALITMSVSIALGFIWGITG